MSSVAIITARSGSKRIPKKNIKDFCGKPIIAYSIEAALKSGIFDEVMVSTDSEEIATIAKRYGANVPFMRSEATSNDFATTADVLEEVLNVYEESGKIFEWFCCIYPTAPFITDEVLKNAMGKVRSLKADSLIPVVQYGYPPQRGLIIRKGYLEYIYPENERIRSQDLEPEYHDAGQFYICNTMQFRKNRTLMMPHSLPLILDEESVQDIDSIADWHMAEVKYLFQKYKERFGEYAMNQLMKTLGGGYCRKIVHSWPHRILPQFPNINSSNCCFEVSMR